jgi:hypothetical protein
MGMCAVVATPGMGLGCRGAFGFGGRCRGGLGGRGRGGLRQRFFAGDATAERNALEQEAAALEAQLTAIRGRLAASGEGKPA